MLIDTIKFSEFVIELHRDDLKLFEGEFSKYYCTLIVKNTIGVTICTIKTTDVEIVNLLDNIYFYCTYNQDTMYSFAMDNTSVIYTIGLRSYKPYTSENIQNYLDIYSGVFIHDGRINKICSINITDKVYELCNKLYKAYVLDSDMEYDTIFNMNPDIIQFSNVKS